MEKIIAGIYGLYEFLCTVLVSIILLSIYVQDAEFTYTVTKDIKEGHTVSYLIKDILSDIEFTKKD